MKKVCHFTVHSRYDIRVFAKECRSLAQAGYEVTLIVPDNKKNEIIDNVHIVSTGFKKRNRIHRIFFGKRRLMRYLKNINADIYHFHDPELLPLGVKLISLGKKVIYDRHENFSTIADDKEWIPKILKKPIQKIFNWFEKKNAQKFDMVIGVTPNLESNLKQLNNNIAIITNYPIVVNQDKKVDNNICTNENYISFAGGVMDLWCHDTIIESLDKCPNIRYKLAGPVTKQYLSKLEALDNYKYVDYCGIVSRKKVAEIYKNSLAGLCIAKYSNNTMQKEGTLGNTKIFEIMLSGIPVICTDFILWKNIIDEFKCGIYVNPYDPDEIAEAINFIKNNKDDAIVMGKNGQEAVLKEFNWSKQEKKLIEIYKNI